MCSHRCRWLHSGVSACVHIAADGSLAAVEMLSWKNGCVLSHTQGRELRACFPRSHTEAYSAQKRGENIVCWLGAFEGAKHKCDTIRLCFREITMVMGEMNRERERMETGNFAEAAGDALGRELVLGEGKGRGDRKNRYILKI